MLRQSLALASAFGLIAALVASAAVAEPTDGVRCLRQQLRAYESMIVPVDPGAPATDGELPTPPPDPNVGDTWDWYIWHLAGFPWAELLPCTVRGEGDNVYIVVEDSQWGVNMFQDDVDYLLERFENSSIGSYPDQGIWELNTTHFGEPPDELDNDPKIYVLWYDFDVSSDGFFWPFDMYPDGTQQFASNECEVVYMNCSDFDPGGDYLTAVVAHEFEHMIHWKHDANESAWVDEGAGELAMWLYGNPDNIVGFNGNPDNNLTDWTGAFADYVKTYLWTLYFFEHYGGQPAIFDLIHQPANGILGYEATLDAFSYDENFADVFADWTVANVLDEESFLDGRFGYAGEELPFFNGVQYSTYPVGPVNATVNHWAADYVRLINGEPQQLNFDGADASTFAARVVTLLADVPLDLLDIPLDAAQSGSVNLPGFGTGYDKVILTVANLTSGGGTVGYSYGTEEATAVGDLPSASALRLTAEPNPLRPGGALRFALPQAADARLDVFDVTGRRVLAWAMDGASAGAHRVPWDGRGARGEVLPSGVYFAKLRAGDASRSVRFSVVD